MTNTYFEVFYREELVANNEIINYCEQRTKTETLDQFHACEKLWKDLADQNESYEYISQELNVRGLIVEKNGITFRRGISYTIRSID